MEQDPERRPLLSVNNLEVTDKPNRNTSVLNECSATNKLFFIGCFVTLELVGSNPISLRTSLAKFYVILSCCIYVCFASGYYAGKGRINLNLVGFLIFIVSCRATIALLGSFAYRRRVDIWHMRTLVSLLWVVVIYNVEKGDWGMLCLPQPVRHRSEFEPHVSVAQLGELPHETQSESFAHEAKVTSELVSEDDDLP